MNEDFVIQNRNNQKIVISYEAAPNSRGLAFMMHGFAGFKQQKHLRASIAAFLGEGYSVVSFDTTNANGESDGDTRGATMHTYIADLEDVISWAKVQSWFQLPFALCGHSMGAQSVAWYASQHTKEVSLLLPFAPMVNSELHLQTISKEKAQILQEKGLFELPSTSRPGVVNVFTLANQKSLQEYDLLQAAKHLNMPILNIVGELDEQCPVQHQQSFLDSAVSADKTLEIIPGVDHNYRATDKNYSNTLTLLGEIIKGWLSQLS